ncbi:MAG: ABC transporter substrate-binding protein [Anaerolineae bacterium]|nr:ABC transporter substrate-binding protein [Anaerolineae bacterium]
MLRTTLRLGLVACLLAAVLIGAALPARAQAGTLVIGVIGTEDSPTFLGVSLVASYVNADGGLTLPDGQVVNISVITQAASSAEEVSAAVQSLRSQNAVAVFGPDDDVLAAQSLQSLATAGVPIFTAATTTKAPVGGFVFRTQANDDIRMSALVDALQTDLALSRIAVYQGGDDFAPQAGSFVLAMAKKQQQPVTTVLQVAGSTTDSSASVAMQAQPDAIAAFGTQDQVVELFTAMVNAGFDGILITNYVTDRAFINRLPVAKRADVVGVTGWSPSFNTEETKSFVAGYVAAFGVAPTALSAAAYDGATALVLAIRANGSNPGQILTRVLTTPSFFALQGIYNPELGTGDLTQSAAVVGTTNTGGQRLIARYNGGERLPADGGETVGAATPIPTTAVVTQPTLAPTTPPIFVTATPDGVVLTIIFDPQVNIRSGPGTNYEIIGRALKGEQLKLFGRVASNQWYVINYNGQQAWITGDPTLVSISGDPNTLPLVTPPATPIPTVGATVAPTAGAEADIQYVSHALNPGTLIQNQPFTLTVTVRNGGGTTAGQFAVAASMRPGEVFGATIVPAGLAPGAATTVNISYAGVPGPAGAYSVAIVLDLNGEVAEGAGEGNNIITINYNVQ